MMHCIAAREHGRQSRSQYHFLRAAAAPRLPPLLKEQELPAASFDKVFASAWLDSKSFVIGTKCNRLLQYQLESRKWIDIPLPERRSFLKQPPREFCGNHSIVINRSGNLLASGGSNPLDVAILELPSFSPSHILVGHTDWIFSSAWLTDTILATGSRDMTVKLWNVGDRAVGCIHPLVSRQQHTDKVRDLKYSRESETLVTLGHDGLCKMWDAHQMQPIASVECPERKELVCMAVQQPLIAIGSQSLISFVDMRCGHVTKSITSADESWGVRSVSFHHDILTVGGGRGRISFLDMRTQRYILTDLGQHPSTKRSISHTTGAGHLVLNDVYREYFVGQEVNHAVYTHCYDPTGSNLLVAGGPLPFGLKGAYVGIW